MTQSRSLVVGCDGTWNEPESLDDGKPAPTNVVKFLEALASLDGRQQVHYEEGVGTRTWEALPGGIYGYGLDKRILGGYRFLRRCFQQRRWERDENKVFLLGFSRGAYTARRLSGLIAHSGLPKNASDAELGWQIYQARDTLSAKRLKKEGRFFDIAVEMIGVWDTVKSTNDSDYQDSKLRDNVLAGYHAMAIDERRKFFPILKWSRDRRATQVWFAGAHSNVGGGLASHGLSDIALRWMIYRAKEHGLEFKQDYVRANVKASPTGKLVESCKGIWVPLGARQRSIPKTDLVHPSVKTRLSKRPRYHPTNLPENCVYWEKPPSN